MQITNLSYITYLSTALGPSQTKEVLALQTLQVSGLPLRRPICEKHQTRKGQTWGDRDTRCVKKNDHLCRCLYMRLRQTQGS